MHEYKAMNWGLVIKYASATLNLTPAEIVYPNWFKDHADPRYEDLVAFAQAQGFEMGEILMFFSAMSASQSLFQEAKMMIDVTSVLHKDITSGMGAYVYDKPEWNNGVTDVMLKEMAERDFQRRKELAKERTGRKHRQRTQAEISADIEQVNKQIESSQKLLDETVKESLIIEAVEKKVGA